MSKNIKTCGSLALGLAILALLLSMAAHAAEDVNLTISYSPEKPIVFEEMMFNAILDKEIDESNLFFDWDFGDCRMEGKSIPHKFAQRGRHVVSLALMRDDTKIAEKTVRFYVYGPRPKIDHFTVKPNTIISGQKAILYWSTCNATSVTIDPLIGNFSLKGLKQVFPNKNTTYTLRATNPDWTAERRANVIVRPPPPSPPKAVIDYSPSEPKPRQDVTLDGSKSSDDGIITLYSWDFGDGYYANDRKIVSHRYTNGDIYKVTLTVFDNNGTKGTSTVSVPVLNKNYWGPYSSTFNSDGTEFFKSYYGGYLSEVSKVPYIENGVSRILINRNGKERVSPGAPLILAGGYELAVRSIDIDGKKVFVELSKDGQAVDSKVVQPLKPYATIADETYYYKTNIGDSIGIVQIAVHFKEVNPNYVVADGVWQISDAVER